jgi:ABC-type phosphate/phosphonate transport system substrate-binding protein
MRPARARLRRVWRLGLLGGGALALWLGAAARGGEAGTPAAKRSEFHLGFSSAAFTAVNENDAKAGIKVWAQTLFRERGLPVDSEPVILRGVEAIAEALRTKRIDAITLNTDEYWRVGQELCADPFIVVINDGVVTEQYLVLVHRDSPMERLADLKGRSLTFMESSRMSLAPAWLDVVLHENGLPPAEGLARVSRANKLSKVVLPVFFRQADACVVTRRAFETMSELNPQLKQRLKVIATSADFVPTGFCFRRGYDSPVRDAILGALAGIKNSPAGVQILTLFQSSSLQAQPISCLESALKLLEAHQRISQGTNGPVVSTVVEAPGSKVVRTP